MPTEAATRKKIIDFRLEKAGWNVADRTQVVEEFFVSPVDEGDGATSSVLREELATFGYIFLLEFVVVL